MRVSSDIWIQHFKKLHSNIANFNSEQEKLKQKFKKEETDIVTKIELLDHLFTEKEVNEVLKKLKNYKLAADEIL